MKNYKNIFKLIKEIIKEFKIFMAIGSMFRKKLKMSFFFFFR